MNKIIIAAIITTALAAYFRSERNVDFPEQKINQKENFKKIVDNNRLVQPSVTAKIESATTEKTKENRPTEEIQLRPFDNADKLDSIQTNVLVNLKKKLKGIQRKEIMQDYQNSRPLPFNSEIVERLSRSYSGAVYSQENVLIYEMQINTDIFHADGSLENLEIILSNTEKKEMRRYHIKNPIKDQSLNRGWPFRLVEGEKDLVLFKTQPDHYFEVYFKDGLSYGNHYIFDRESNRLIQTNYILLEPK